MLGTIMMTGMELAGGIGIGTMVGTASTALIPAEAGAATKACVAVGSGLTALAVDRIVMREFEGYCNDVKSLVTDVRTIRANRKMVKEAEKLAKAEEAKAETKEEK